MKDEIKWVLCGVVVIFFLIGTGYILTYNNDHAVQYAGWVTVTHMKYSPSHTSTTLRYDPASKTSKPITEYHSAYWEITVKADGGSTSLRIDQKLYERLSIGSKVYYTYKIGGLLGNKMDEHIYLEEPKHDSP